LQTKRLLAAAEGNRLQALYVLAIGTGMRCGELLGLQWADIDLKAGSLSVRRTLLELNGNLSFGEPKSAAGKRSIRLPAMVTAALWDHKARMMQEGHGANPLVFVTGEGTPYYRSDLRRHAWLPLLKLAELPTIRFHDLRHTSATLLLGEGIHPKIVQERLGHSTVTLTLNTYSHVLPSMQDDAAIKLDGVMSKAIG
jgi:integrase